MRKAQKRKIARYIKQNRNRRVWHKIVQFMACVVVFCTTYALILPAITVEKDYMCGMEPHTHEAACYSEVVESSLVCQLPERTAHAHEDSCYEADTLICTVEAFTPHIHAEECMDEAGELICTLEEQNAHQHGEGCYETETQTVLHCQIPEHVHSDSCSSDPNADLETAENWEATLDHVVLTDDWAKDLVAIATTQVGYKESEHNYQAEDGRPLKGYTRYGAWYGIPYGDWDSMFVSFCLHYAGIPQEVICRSSDSGSWLTSLSGNETTAGAMNQVPGAGDLVFYQEHRETSTRVAIVLGRNNPENNGSDSQGYTALRVIEGDRDNQVVQRLVNMEDITLQGCCSITRVQETWNVRNGQAEPEETDAPEMPGETDTPEMPEDTAELQYISQTRETDNYIVTVTYSPDLVLPEGAQLRVMEYPKDSDIFRQRCEEAGYELEWLLNIGFFLDDDELSLDGAFDVLVTSKEGENLGQDITHFADTGVERITGSDASDEVEEGQTAVAFASGSFSDFGGGVAVAAESGGAQVAAAGDAVTGFRFVTADPRALKENVDYVIYLGNGTSYTFMSGSLSSASVSGSDANSPYQVGGTWSIRADAMGTDQISDMAWRVVKTGAHYYLRSSRTNNYLRLNNGWSSQDSRQNASVLRNTYVDGAAVQVGDGTYHIRYEDSTWKSTWHNNNYSYWTQPTTIYFAEVTPLDNGNYPDAVYTGSVHVDRLRFYNICESPETGVSSLAGCVFLVEGTTSGGQKYSTTITSSDSVQIALPDNIPDGVYTIKEVSVPEGYMRDLNHTREFRIENGSLESEHNIGIFLNHSLEQLTVGKTGEVEDYNNRIYQILLNATTNLRMYHMDPIEVLFVVDKSNSMLFPSGMNSTGKTITLRTDGQNNVGRNQRVLDSLDKDIMHYIIADPEGSSTVYAVWHDGTAWLYQDASYYAKAKFNNGTGYESTGETVIFPGDRSYSNQSTWEDQTYGTEYRSNGGGLNHSMSGSTLGTYIDDQGGAATFQLYTAKDQYNRLHYLEEALANMIYELADANPNNRVILIPFTKEVQTSIYYPLKSSNAVRQPVTLTTSNAEMLFDIVTHVDTSGGTRQDLALEYAYETYLDENDGFDKAHTYTILVTDGAPVRSGSSSPPLGDVNSQATTADDGAIFGRIKGWGAKVREQSTLMTVALGMEHVEGGKQVLQQIASDDEFYCALDDASALTQSMQRILFDGMKDQGELLIDNGYIVDEISDSFYPIAWTDRNNTGRTVLTRSNGKTWLLMQTGDWITLEGKFTTAGASDAAGQLLCRDDGTYYIQWENQTLSGSGWNGTFYVKAKEDFIGGNAIDTNKQAAVTVNDATKPMATPTVNVHLLDINENSSEATIYLGDLIYSADCSPGDILKAFYEQIGFGKVQDETYVTQPERMNRLDPDADTADGLERNLFYLKYALGYTLEDGTWMPRDLTDDEWATLEAGGSLSFPYVYDDASSHGNVGYFTISLTKTSDTYDTHTSSEACQPGGQPLTENCGTPAETYILTVTYTAYELGEQGRPNANVNNGTGSPGTEVTRAAVGLNNGQGIVISENIHEVHVISGKIVVEKVFAAGTEWTAGDTFTFLLTDENGVVTSQTVTISAEGKATATFDGLARGTYTVSEAIHDQYAVKTVMVVDHTNCYYSQTDPMQVSFVMGNNLSNADVIGKANPGDAFTSYIDPVNGVYGEAVFTNGPRVYTGDIPVEKIWYDGQDTHIYDSVYVVLYLDDQPVLDTQGHARILKLDASTNWKGSFTVVLADKDDTLANYSYSVREVANTSDGVLNGWHPSILENDGTTVLYYDKALENGGLIGINGRGYQVEYTTGADGTLAVNNHKGFDLPQTGGTGTHKHMISGLSFILAALLYGCSQRRKRERGASG